MAGKIILLLVVIVGIVSLIFYGVKKTEKYECQLWSTQAKEYPNYYITQWQKNQCDHYNIDIGAKVRETVLYPKNL